MTLKHGLHHWIVSEYELEMSLTRSHTVLEFDHEIIVSMGRWPKINFSQYGICSNMVANSLPEITPSTLVRSLFLGIFYRSKLSSAGTRRVVVSF